VIKRNKDTIIINCMNEESINKIEQTLNNKLTNSAKIEKVQIKKPIVKIIGIDKIFNSEEELEQDINIRNFNSIEDKCKVQHIFNNPKANSISAILEVTSTIYKHIRDNKNKLFVGYQNCRVFDITNTNPCPSCLRYGHGSKKCPNQATCYMCAENHLASECKSKTLKCANCEFHNTKFKTNYDINHCAIDSEKCEVLKNKIKKYIDSTDYPMQPTYQRYFGKLELGKAENFQRQQGIRKVRISSAVSNSTLTSVTDSSQRSSTSHPTPPRMNFK
jgi:hypothetical protein